MKDKGQEQKTAERDWTEVVDGHINVPDELMPLFNKVATQMRFHTISGKGEVETVAHIVWHAQQFFKEYRRLSSDHDHEDALAESYAKLQVMYGEKCAELNRLSSKEDQGGRERILCAAIWYDDGQEHIHQPVNIKQGFVMCGRRHHNIINNVAGILQFKPSPACQTQGFITNIDRFVDREEGLSIAILAGQIKKATYGDRLYSEDLY